MKISFSTRLHRAVQKKQSRLCVGIDPRLEQLPESILLRAKKEYGETLKGAATAVAVFQRGVLDAVQPFVSVVKFQSAFYERLGSAGLEVLQEGIQEAHLRDLLVIVDAKRGDIDSTAEAYAQAFLGEVMIFGKPVRPIPADALTVNPFLGRDSLVPFVQEANKHGTGIFVLVKTSNPGSRDFQGIAGESGLCEQVAKMVSELALGSVDDFGFSSIGAVVGATHPAEARALRALLPHSIFLVPGIGAQGGSFSDLDHFFLKDGLGAIVSASRSVVFGFDSGNQEDFLRVIARKAEDHRDRINAALFIQ